MSARTKIWLLILPLFLTACADADIDELQQWMTEQRAQTRPRVTPIPEPKKFTPQAYLEEGAVDPFSLQRLTQALRQESSGANANAALVAPELSGPELRQDYQGFRDRNCPA